METFVILLPMAVNSFTIIETRGNHLGSSRSITPLYKLRPVSNYPPLAATSEDIEGTTGPVGHVIFEYCTGCNWFARSSWMAQELLTTFNDDNLSAITLVPSRPPPGARFVVTFIGDNQESVELWDREKREGFPEVKELKQLVRDLTDPDRYLGHSDTEKRNEGATSVVSDSKPESSLDPPSSEAVLASIIGQVKGPNVSIRYCTGCRWLLRAAYFVTELMTTFSDEIDSITLIPSRSPEKGGIFTVTVDDKVVWDRAEEGGFPETKELKQRVRDILSPSKYLGHSDNRDDDEDDDSESDDIDDKDATEMRAFYGVQ